MEYTTLGRTGAVVGRLGFGGAVLGLTNYITAFDPQDRKDRDEAFGAIAAALAVGINYYDTAAGYGDGTSERILGEALQGVAQSNGVPLFLASKVSPRQSDVRAGLEQSLVNLRRDRIDLLQIHGSSFSSGEVDEILAPGGLAEQLIKLRDEGMIGFVGFTSEDNNDSVYRLIRSGAFDTFQTCYNFLFQHPYEPSRPFGSILEADNAGLGVIAMRVATSGTFQRWLAMVNPTSTFDYTPALIQYVLSNPLLDVALVGMRTAEEVRRNLMLVDDLDGRISLDDLHQRYVQPEKSE